MHVFIIVNNYTHVWQLINSDATQKNFVVFLEIKNGEILTDLAKAPFDTDSHSAHCLVKLLLLWSYGCTTECSVIDHMQGRCK